MAYDYSDTTYESRLTDGADRFLAHTIEHALFGERRSSKDFLRHFPPSTIMNALGDFPALRADILEASTGVRRKIALKKSAQSAGEDLQIALDEGEALADEVVSLFRPDDRVRYLQRRALWAFLIEDAFWQVDKSDAAAFTRAQDHIAFMLDRALKDDILSHQQVIDGIGIGSLAQMLPREALEAALSAALREGRAGASFADKDLYDSLSAATLVAHVPLPVLWEQVIHPCIAMNHGFIESQLLKETLITPDKSRRGKSSEAPPANTNEANAASATGRQDKPTNNEGTNTSSGVATSVGVTVGAEPPSNRSDSALSSTESSGFSTGLRPTRSNTNPPRRGLLANSHPVPATSLQRTRPLGSGGDKAAELDDDAAFDLSFDQEVVIRGGKS